MPSFLFPVPPSRIASGFTTSTAVRIPNVVNVELSDTALGVHKVTGHTTHNVVTTDDGKQAWEAVFPEGSINPGNKEAPHGGFGFYLKGTQTFERALRDQAPDEVEYNFGRAFHQLGEFRCRTCVKSQPYCIYRPPLASCQTLRARAAAGGSKTRQ